MQDILKLSAVELGKKIAAGEITSVEATKAYLDKIGAVDKDINAYITVCTEKALKDAGLKTKMVLQIHDELIFKVPKEEKEKAYEIVKSVMTSAMDLSVPLEVDGGFGLSWYDCK